MATREGAQVHVPTAIVNWTGKPVERSPFCLHHSWTTLSSCENRWKKFHGFAKSAKVIVDTSNFLALKFPPLLRLSRSEVFDKPDIKGNLLFKRADDTNQAKMYTYIDGDARPHHQKKLIDQLDAFTKTCQRMQNAPFWQYFPAVILSAIDSFEEKKPKSK